jgi:hypothetical protein
MPRYLELFPQSRGGLGYAWRYRPSLLERLLRGPLALEIAEDASSSSPMSFFAAASLHFCPAVPDPFSKLDHSCCAVALGSTEIVKRGRFNTAGVAMPSFESVALGSSEGVS